MKKEGGKIKKAGAGRWRFPPFAFCLLPFAFIGLGLPVLAQTNSAVGMPSAEANDGARRFNIQEYRVSGGTQLPTNILAGVFAPYTGTNRSEDDLVKAASDLQRAYRAQGYPAMSISVAGGQTTNGILTLNVFFAASPQILVSGRHYASAVSTPPTLPAAELPQPQNNTIPTGAATNTAPAAAAETAAVATVAATNAVPAPTNAGPRFRVDNYLVRGNSILSPGEVSGIFTNVPGAFGTNVTVDAILKAAGNLQTAYRDRGYLTVVVGLPPQKLTNAEVNVKVTEAPLVAINVQNEGAHYFSSNNVMRALPDLHTNMLLNSKIFQSELDLANQNRDRQIYPTVGPGPQPGTSELTLGVKDRLPWHARLELNNDQSTPGTPELRVNFNTEYDNLWDLEHQVGLQYSFSPEQSKAGNDYVQVPFDEPLVANYSAYYRLPLGGYPSVQNQVEAHPGNFGYNEATHQFNLPPSTGRPELTFFASRSVSDSGVQKGPTGYAVPPAAFTNNGVVYNPLSYTTNSAGENIILNEDVGGKLVWPLPQIGKMALTFSFGADYKVFKQTSYNTNENNFVLQYTDQQGNLQTINSYVPQGYPPAYTSLYYLPLNAGFNGSVADKLGTTFFNSQVNFNVLPGFSDDADFARVSGVNPAKANYVTLQLGADRVQALPGNWSVKLHADGQWANGTLFSDEQYAMGGAMGVRGYQDGAAYGDEGWRVMVEPQTPPIQLGMFGNQGSAEPCWVRGSVFMDYGQLYAMDGNYFAQYVSYRGLPAGSVPNNPSRLSFWGTGWSITANIGSHLDARLTMAFPLVDPAGRPGFQPDHHMQINFGIGGQF
jgi:hemolysin activation/secretion protein